MSLNVESDEGHFVIPLRELATGQIHNVRYLRDQEGLFFTGYMPEYRLFFKDEWEIAANERARNWHIPAAIGGALILGAMAGILLDLFVH